MRSNLFASTLAIALGVASPIVGAIVFPEIAVAGFASVKVVPKLTPLEVKQKEDQDQHNLEIELSALQQSLISYRQKGDQKSEFETAVKISDIYFKLENPKESEKIIRDYLNLLRYKKDYNSEEFLVEIIRQYIKNWNFKAGYGIVSNQYISNRYRRGEISWDKVLEFSTFNLYISRIIKDYEQEIDSLHGMGWSYRNLGKFDNAINYYKEAIDVSKLKGKSLFKAMFLHIEIGTVYTDMGLYNEALDSFNLSLNLSSLSNLNDDEKGGLRKFALTRIGLNYIKSGNYDLALKYLEEADSNRIIGLNIDRHNLEIGLAEIYYRQGKYDLSLRTYENIYSGTLDVSDREYILSKVENWTFKIYD